MPGTIDNKNAEKWTQETTMQVLNKILKLAMAGDAVYIGDALVQCGLYNQIWAFWKAKFKDDLLVFETIKKIETIFEAYLVKNGLHGQINTTMAIFALKNNHNWTDKNETTINQQSTDQPDLSCLTDAELEQLAAIETKIRNHKK